MMRAIAVSGWAGAGKSTLAKALAERFRFDYFSVGEWFRKKAEKTGMDIKEFMKVAPPEMHREIDSYVKKIARKGNVVIDGRLSGFMAGEHAFKIFLTAPVEVRARRISTRDGIAYEKALKIVRERDEQDVKNYLKIYGIDLRDLSIYNLVLDTQFFDIREMVEVVSGVVARALELQQI